MPSGSGRRVSGGRRAVLALGLFLVVLSVTASSGLVVYTAWLHDLKNGAFALIFAVLSAQVAINWFLWRDEMISDEDPLTEDSV